MEKCKVLIVEDEEKIARFLEIELKYNGYMVDIAADGIEGLKKVEESTYDLILLDIMLPGLDGMEVCRRIRKFSDVSIIMLTAKDGINDLVTGLDSGADDYITKPFKIEEILARIRAVARRKMEAKAASKILKVGDIIVDTLKHQVTRNGMDIELSKREFDLLVYLIINVGIVLSREQILEAVWGYDFFGGANVVDVYIRYLRSKIDDDFETKLIYTMRGVGYVLKEGKN